MDVSPHVMLTVDHIHVLLRVVVTLSFGRGAEKLSGSFSPACGFLPANRL